MFTEALFTVAERQKQPKCPLTDKCTKRRKPPKTQILSLATTWMNLSMLHERKLNQSQNILYESTYVKYQKLSILEFLLWPWIKNLTSVARVTAELWYQSLAWELPYSLKRPKKKKKKGMQFPGSSLVMQWVKELALSCSGSGCCCGMGLTPDPGISTCHGLG